MGSTILNHNRVLSITRSRVHVRRASVFDYLFYALSDRVWVVMDFHCAFPKRAALLSIAVCQLSVGHLGCLLELMTGIVLWYWSGEASGLAYSYTLLGRWHLSICSVA